MDPMRFFPVTLLGAAGFARWHFNALFDERRNDRIVIDRFVGRIKTSGQTMRVSR